MSHKEKNPLFTVIIPTKDRAQYLYHTLRTCSLQDYDNLEVIVSDDGSSDNTREVVEEMARKDPRIRYVSPGSGVGMLDNFEFALDQVRPGYVMALGGDDALLPHGITGMIEVMQSLDQQLLTWPAPIYIYSGTKRATGQLILPARRFRMRSGRRIIRSSDFLAKQVRDLYYVTDIECPMFYVKGVASTELVKRVRSRTPDGRFYACATPDGFSGIVLAGEVESFAYSDVPFSMYGCSPTSAGLGYYANDDRAKKQSEAFFKQASRRPMHADLGRQPYSPLISLMTADYLLTARDLPGWPGSFPPIDYKCLLKRGLEELADGLFAYSGVARELGILHGVARHHGLGEFFRREVGAKRRNLRQTLEGNAVSPGRIYLDAEQLRIRDVFDAAYAAYNLHNLGSAMTLAVGCRALQKSVDYRLLSFRKGRSFPPESEWLRQPDAVVSG